MTDDSRPKLHPLWGTPLFVVAGSAAIALSGVTVLLIGVAILSTSGQEVSVDAVVTWAADKFLLGTFVMWLFLAPTTVVVGGWLAGLDRIGMGLVPRRASALMVLGAVFGGATLLLPAVIARLFGGYVPAAASEFAEPTGTAALASIAFTAPVLLVAAFGEELVFRGFLLRYWQRSAGGPAALVVSAALFTAVHGMNAHASIPGWIGIFLAGLWLGVALMVTRSLWFVTGLHVGWNLATSVVLGLPVSGFSLPSLTRWEAADTELANNLLGGSFGPESGIAFHVTLTVSLVALLAVGPALRVNDAPTEGAG